MHGDDLVEYYARRAREYDVIYAKPERRQDLALLKQHLRKLLAGRHVLELACGTGYWTEAVSPAVSSMFATDINSEVLSIAESRRYSNDNVRFARIDIHNLSTVTGKFDAVFTAFYWSHLPKRDLPFFLADLGSKFSPGTLVVFVDNLYVEGSSTPISRTDEDGNTYQDRTLADGSRFRVLKNFPDAQELRDAIGACGENLDICLLTYYWCASYHMAE
jgi:demethylmenaquinone methyltransferase/2-methoxy-6-polyprenyl-1,4-benzoquinol methylase